MPPRKKKKEAEEGPFDDTRGGKGMGGWWISLETATTQCGYEAEWWAMTTREGRRVEPVQHVKNAPADRPVWMFENGDMYLGEWEKGTKNEYPVEQGFGITYNEFPRKVRGLIYIGEWNEGDSHGKGESLWLESSRTWQNNQFPGSAIKRPGGGIPFHYCGMYENDKKCDKEAIVRLKDGTTRKGPWKDGHPEGGWDSHASVAWGGTASSSPSSDDEEEEEEEEAKPLPATKRQRTARQQRQDQREENHNPDPPVAPVAVKQEPTDDEAEEEDRSTTVRAATGARGNLPVDAIADKERRLQQIQRWISETVIGDNPSPATMKDYASRLFQQGFESVEMIKKRMKPSHVESYGGWMKPFHQERFLDNIHENWEEF